MISKQTLLIVSLACLLCIPADAADVQDLEAAIRAIVNKDPTGALVSLDADGQPRIRSVDVRPLDRGLVFWVATKPNTRKVTQIAEHPQVALHFNVDAEGSYVSVMGRARLVEDAETINRISWREPEVRNTFWPRFPEDYLLIEITPDWIEVTGEGVPADTETWRPAALELNR